MARNEEKHFGRLNRLHLQRERDEYLKHHPKRPKLDSLQTAEEITQWLPSIKADMNFYLKQSQVVCYCDRKVIELREKVNQFEKEYKAFLRRVRELNPNRMDAVPWTPRAYKSKTEGPPLPTNQEENAFVPIFTPILESALPDLKSQPHCLENLPLSDKPLQFNSPVTETDAPKDCSDLDLVNDSVSNESSGDSNMFHSCQKTLLGDTSIDYFHSFTQPSAYNVSSSGLLSMLNPDSGNKNVKFVNNENYYSHPCNTSNGNVSCQNILGLDYDSSSEDDNEATA